MLIWNKNKHFDKIILDFFNNSMADIRELNLILHHHGATPFIKQNTERFVTFTFLFLLFFQETALNRKYIPKYKNEVAAVLDALIFEISKRFNYLPEKITKVYLQLRNQLNDWAFDEKAKETGLYYGVACHYLVATLPKEFDTDNTDVYFELATFFQSRINKNIEYLSTIT